MTSSFRDEEPSRHGIGDDHSMTDSVVPAAGERWIYHFTHVDNLAGIRFAVNRADFLHHQGICWSSTIPITSARASLLRSSSASRATDSETGEDIFGG